VFICYFDLKKFQEQSYWIQLKKKTQMITKNWQAGC